MIKDVNFKLFLSISLGFIGFTVIGTLSHELGHCMAAKYLGMTNIELHYGSMNYDDPNSDYERELYALYEQEIKEYKDFPKKAEYDKLIGGIKHNSFIITASGPLQSMLTGTIGLIVLIFYGKKFKDNNSIKFIGWLFIFLSLFWLRQSANFIVGFTKFIFNGHKWGHSDEIKLARYLHLPPYSMSLFTAIIGIVILAWLSIVYIPKKDLKPFILGGLIGGILGYLLWLNWLGEYILP
jgi:hypothetical protein